MTMLAILVAAISCGSREAAQTPAESLIDRLSDLVEQGKIMYGHQDDLMYGHSWKLADDATEYVQSDVHATCGQYPAVYGLDLGGIEMDCSSSGLQYQS